MSAVLGIDLGTKFFKVAYVKTGSFDLVLNEASKRKSANAVSFNEGERMVGDTANALKMRFPKRVTSQVQRLLGRMVDDPIIKEYGFGEYDLPFKISKHETRGTAIIEHDTGEKFQPEEVLAYIFSYIRQISEAHLEQKVSEAVITVPPFMTEHERRMIHESATLVDLKVLMLLNDNTAAALRYGIETPTPAGQKQNVLFVDLGASHMTNTIVTYFTNNVSSYESVPSMEVRAVTYVPTVGGTSFDRKVTAYMAEKFNEMHSTKLGKKIQDYPKAMMKLATSVEKVKSVLSANTETMLIVESLLDEVDFKLKFTRSEFEEICADLFTQLEAPIAEAIKKSGLEASEIEQVVPFGGATRMPKLKTAVLKATDRKDWTPRINTDEAAALGAAFVAANFSKSFKLRKYHVYDLFPFSIGVSVGGKEATLFKPDSAMEAKKTLTQSIDDEMTEKDSLSLSLSYDKKEVLPVSVSFEFPMDLAEYTVTGMNNALKKHNVTGTPKVALAIGLGQDGLTDLIHADAKIYSMDLVKNQRFVKKNVTVEQWVPLNETEANGTNFTEGIQGVEEQASEKVIEKEATGEKNEATEEGIATINETSNKTAANKTKSIPRGKIMNVTKEKTVEVWEETLQKVLHLEPLNITRIHKGVAFLSDEEFSEAIKRHKQLMKEEKERTDKVNAKNDVEAWIFSSRQKLGEDGMELVSTEEERSAISTLLEEGEDWLWEDGEDVAASVYKSKKANMTNEVKDVFLRYDELEKRAAAMKHFEAVVQDTRVRVINWTTREEKRIATNESTWIHTNETNRLSKMVDEAETWLKEKVDELEKAGLFVKPPFTARECLQQIRPVEAEVEYLRYRPKPRSKKKPKAKTNMSNSSSANATDADATGNTTHSAKDPAEEKSAEHVKDPTPKEDL
jgi:hypoxia up-regulated 1